jgi:hypothetical protein
METRFYPRDECDPTESFSDTDPPCGGCELDDDSYVSFVICGMCNGSGEGPASGTRCPVCNGLGEVKAVVEQRQDEYPSTY